MAALSIEEVLAAEADALNGPDRRLRIADPPRGQDAQEQRRLMNADRRDGQDLAADEVERRERFYRSLNKLNRAALCLSGGGIRSATFCLGVLQALADYDVSHPVPRAPDKAPTDTPARRPAATHADAPTPKAIRPTLESKPAIDPARSLLGRIHYLSTVSGGGYVGSWLSSWRMRDDFPTVVRNLTGRPSGADVEPPEISWLRSYSNYLTPRIGLASADTWAAIAICVRNLVLNWLIIIPVVCLALLLLKVIVTGSVWLAHDGNDGAAIVVLLLGLALLVGAQAFTTGHRPARRPAPPGREGSEQPGNVTERQFLCGDLLWAVLSAICVTVFFASDYYWSHHLIWVGPVAARLGLDPAAAGPILTALAALPIYALGWILGCRPHHGTIDFICWTLSGLVYGGLVGLGADLYGSLDPHSCVAADTECRWALLTPMIFGVPWVLMSQLAADNIFGGLVSYEVRSDADREWLGRAAGWLTAVAIAWAIVAFLASAAAFYVQTALSGIEQIATASTGGIAGIIAALLGKGSMTPANSSRSDQATVSATACNLAIAVAGPIFAAILIVGLSIALDQALLGDSLVRALRGVAAAPGFILGRLLIGFAVLALIALTASRCVNINRFSLHALYRNRLIRAYLGASRQQRHPDLFTGFDPQDNVRMHELWPPKPGGAAGSCSLFHVINIALNVVSTKRLAWQERKAESFTVSALHCGSAYLGYRSSAEYGDGPDKDKHRDDANPADPAQAETREQPRLEADRGRQFGISLGTAMAISGAAVSPNMGYHSSPAVALLLTLFNVRLGWWLGNPGAAGEESYQREGPKWAALPLIYEAFGQTTDARRYVYLSDGGHFENLGLYEMVRRRCRFIVVVDAGCDPIFAFEDLGNAVRKVFIDLGVRIEFEGLDRLRNRPTDAEVGSVVGMEGVPYHAIGTIDYKAADGDACENGSIIYIKPAYHGTESAGVRSYATAHPTFPHETTTDQWFTESQFESYRSLGAEIAGGVFDQQAVRWILHRFLGARGQPTVA